MERSQQRFPYGKAALYSLGYFTSNLTWSTYNVFVPLFLSSDLRPFVGESSINTLVAAIMILDNIAAILIQPYIGAVSDRTWIGKLGRRMPFIIIGIPLAAFFFGFIGTFWETLWILIIAISGFNISMAFYRSPVMSLIPDFLPKAYRSQGSGVLNVIGSVGSILGLVIVSLLERTERTTLAFWLLSIIMIFCLIILFFNVKEQKDIEIEGGKKVNFILSLKSLFKENNPGLLVLLFAVFFNIAGYNVVETYISRYVTEILGFPKEHSGFILAIFVTLSVVFAIPAGLVGRRVGALNACLIGLIGFLIAIIPITIISLTNIPLLRDIITLNTYYSPKIGWETPFYLLLIFLLGFSWLIISINSIVVIWNIAPKGKNATYTSYFYVFLHLASIISPFLAGGIFDFYAFIGRKIGYPTANGLKVFFLYVCVSFIFATIFMFVFKLIRTKTLRKIKDTNEYILQRLEEKEYPLLFLPMLLFGVGLRLEKAFIELWKQQNRERKELRKKINHLRKKLRKLKSNVLIGDLDEIEKDYIQKLDDYLEHHILLQKEHQEKRRELLDEIKMGKIKKKLEKDNEKDKK